MEAHLHPIMGVKGSNAPAPAPQHGSDDPEATNRLPLASDQARIANSAEFLWHSQEYYRNEFEVESAAPLLAALARLDKERLAASLDRNPGVPCND